MMNKDTNPKNALGVKKVPMHTVPCAVLMEMGLGMLEGGRKYGTHNYRSMGVLASVYYDGAMRHLMDWWEGEDVDPDSGLSHITKALTCLCVLRDSMIMGNWKDDRPIRLPKGLDILTLNEKAAEIIKKYPECKAPFTQFGTAAHKKLEDVYDSNDFSRGGHDWFVSEDELLRRQVGVGYSIGHLASLHQRTELAITCRMEKLGIELKESTDETTNGVCFANEPYAVGNNLVCNCKACIARRQQNNVP